MQSFTRFVVNFYCNKFSLCNKLQTKSGFLSHIFVHSFRHIACFIFGMGGRKLHNIFNKKERKKNYYFAF